ncbi:hypothetical protein B0T21DRAFT_279850 [Apiosordaria backusii]|uniref:Uncharacterized protein n=1 Tax=Apiosordaria backusii TaxID=314023 RepID=A0AA40ESZ2_9PEZI|nr:hypothetical protein B0T21DRAFT_279850 [Apiosordaria backusii]
MNDTDIQCGFDGNGDIYGMGVRVGIYLQWATSVLAEHLHEPAVESTRGANTIFQFAMLAGLILITTSKAIETRAIEGYITLLFCFASAWIASLPGYSAARAAFGRSKSSDDQQFASSGIRGEVDLLLGMATCSYGVWFMFCGLDRLPRTACPEAVFFFAPVHPFGWFRTVAKIAFVASLVASLVLTPLHTWLLARDMAEYVAHWRNPIDPPAPSDIVRTVHLRLFKFFGNLAAMAIFIVAVELTLFWNNIRSIHTCDTFSQLFPLMVGTTNFARICYQLSKSLVLGDARIAWQWK